MDRRKDADLVLEIASKVRHQSMVTSVDPNIPFVEKHRIIASSRLVLGMRLHSIVFAALERIPFVGIVYDPKIENMLRLLGRPEPYLYVDNMNVDDIRNRLDRALEDEDRFRDDLERVVPTLAEKSMECGKIALQLTGLA
jgi:polysaccharide pyruvyl transferase WcaK-like protein